MRITNHYQHAAPLFSGVPKKSHIGKKLASKLMPQNPQISYLFRSFINLDMILATKESPEGRLPSFKEVDIAFQQEVQKLVNSGVITSGSLVISNTGHCIPIAAQLAQNKNLTMQAVFNCPSNLTPESGTRLRDQIKDFGDKVVKAQRAGASRNPNIIFIGLEAHREVGINACRLPSVEALKAFGIHKVVYLTEDLPTGKERTLEEMTSDIRPYLKLLHNSGLPVVSKGVDHRSWQENPVELFIALQRYNEEKDARLKKRS